MRVEIVSPEDVFYSGEADMVIARTTQGEVGILKDHEPMLASLDYAEMRIYDGSRVRDHFAVYGGFMEMRDNVVRVLSDDAEMASDIDFTQANDELDEIRLQLQADPENEELELAYRRAFVRAEVSRPD